MLRLFFILLISLSSLFLSAQNQPPFRVVFWNTENFFDTRHDSLKNDMEFLPHSMRHWNHRRYKKKLDNVARTLTAIGEWNFPALIGLCEVENDSVLIHLLNRTPLKQQQYRYCMTHGSDTRGINSALLYQRTQFGYISHKEHPVLFTHKTHKQTRNILHVWGKVITSDTLDVFVCHLPSRYGGEKESEADRFDAARTLRHLCDSLLQIRKTPQLLIMGDFNDTPENASITQILSAGKTSGNPVSGKLYNLFADPHVLNNPGTHKYQGEWNQLDHIIVSGNLIDKNSPMHVVPGSNRIFMPPFLLTNDKTWHGKRPFRTYYGFKYEGGYSDHLPLITDFLLSLPNKD